MLKVTFFALKRHLPIESVPLLPWTLGSSSTKQETWSFFRKETFEGSGHHGVVPCQSGQPQGRGKISGSVPGRSAWKTRFPEQVLFYHLGPLSGSTGIRVCQQGALCWIKHSVLGRGAQKTTRTHLYYVFFSPLLYHIIFEKPFIYILLLMYSWCTILCFRCTTEWFTSFIGYPSFVVIIKYWLCSLCCTIYFYSLFILYILVGTSFFIQFSSVAQSCLTLCDSMDCSTPGFPVHHQFPELAQTHVHQVGDATQPTHPLLYPFPSAFN